jgi:hypothetical protein
MLRLEDTKSRENLRISWKKVLVQEPLGRSRRRWKDNFKINAFENRI